MNCCVHRNVFSVCMCTGVMETDIAFCVVVVGFVEKPDVSHQPYTNGCFGVIGRYRAETVRGHRLPVWNRSVMRGKCLCKILKGRHFEESAKIFKRLNCVQSQILLAEIFIFIEKITESTN